MSAPLYVRQLGLGPMKNFVYLVGRGDADEVLVVDPAWDVAAIVKAAEGDQKRITGVFLSHHHADHINGVPELLRRFDIPVYAQRTEVDFSPELRAFQDALRPLHPGDVVEAGAGRFRTVHTPGHTPGSQCLLAEDALITGDTVFVNACGRCDFRGGSPEEMFQSLKGVLGALPDDTRLFPGHDYGDVPVSSLGRERGKNPYFQFTEVDAFVSYRMRPRR